MTNRSILKKIIKLNKIKFDACNINNIEIGFLDFDGKLREIIIPKSKLYDKIKNGAKCDGSSIGVNDITESDLDIFLDIHSAYILPNKNLLIMSNTNDNFDSRKQLIKLEKRKKNLKINIGIEVEFFLQNNFSLDKLGYYEIENSNEFICLNEIINFCESVNFPIENCHHECGNGQFEINFKYDIAHKTADNLIYLKKIIQYFAQKHKLIAFFSPKPFEKECGNGMHTNISVFQKNKNLFYSATDKLHLSKFAYLFANGIINHIESITAISNPTEESFVRLNTGNETPKQINISCKDRSSLIRVPLSDEKSTRLEFRLPDGSANPYSLLCAIILAGFDEKTKKIICQKLPKNLLEAKKCLAQDKLFNLLNKKI